MFCSCSPRHRLRSDRETAGRTDVLDVLDMSDSQAETLIMGEGPEAEGLQNTSFPALYIDKGNLLEDWRPVESRPFAPMDPSVTRSRLRLFVFFSNLCSQPRSWAL